MSCGLKRFAWIGKHTRGFPISGDNVAILQHPSEYFRSIKVCAHVGHLFCSNAHAVIFAQDAIAAAQHRIVMSSLYLGSGGPEQEIVRQ